MTLRLEKESGWEAEETICARMRVRACVCVSCTENRAKMENFMLELTQVERACMRKVEDSFVRASMFRRVLTL